MTVLCCLFLLVFILSIIFLLRNLQGVVEDFKSVVHDSGELIAQSHLLSKLVIDMETGQRGFIITGKEEFLEPYNIANAKFDKVLGELREDVSERAKYLKALEKIEHLRYKWIGIAGEPEIEARKLVERSRFDLKTINRMIISQKGKHILDKIRVTINAMVDDFRKAGKKDELILITQIIKDVVDSETGERGFLLAGKDWFLEPYYMGQLNFSKHVEQLEKMLTADKENLKRLSDVKEKYGEWLVEVARPEIHVRVKYEKDQRDMDDIANLLAIGTGKKIIDELREVMAEFTGDLTKEMKRKLSHSEQSVALSYIISLIIGSTGILLSISLVFLVGRSIIKPISILRKGTEIIGSGDLSHRIGLKARDELGVLADSFNKMTEDLKNTIDNLNQEIADRKQAEEALAESHAALSESQRIANLGSWELDLNTQIITLSEEHQFMAEREPKETSLPIAEYAVDYVVEEDIAIIEDRLAFATQSIENSSYQDNFEYRLKTDDVGGYKHFAVQSQFKSKGIINGVSQNITKQRLDEDALRQSEDKYRTILESIEDGYFEVDISGNFRFFNDSLCKIFGYSRDELMGMNNRQYTDEENAKELNQTFNKVYTTGKPDKGFGWEILRKDGTKRAVEASVSLRKDAEGKPIGFRGVVRDISEKQSLEAKLQHAQKMEAIGTLAGGVAHDLNNILGGLVSYPELLLLKLPEDSPLRKSILTIQKSGEKAAAVVQDLLTLARRGVVITEVVNPNDIISEYLESLEHEKIKSYHPGIHIETHLEKEVLNILGSSTHLSKTVMNLVSNAAEAMPEGGLLTVSTENRYVDRSIRGYNDVKQGDYVVLTVSDTGTGIDPDDMEKIFEPFYTKKKMGRSGTGLGMAVVWGTVKDHNGYIDVQSTEGKGTTFTLYFPVTRKSVEERSEMSIKDYMGKGEAILVVDDVEEQRKTASDMLRELGYSVAMVSSGEEAVEYLKTNKADLLLLDMIMDPGIDGLDTYKRIIEIHHGQKAIIASGFSETDRVKELQSLGAGAYVRKPFLLEKIGLAVREELEK